ncbi:MAG: PGF-pre-PGF domain-containing protein [Methanolobus sp.]
MKISGLRMYSVYTKKGEVTDFDFYEDKNDIDYIRYTSLKNAGKISTTIEVLKSTSSFADKNAPGIVYRNINIWVGKTGYATGSNIEDPFIGFRVSREWIENNNIDPATISIYRYNDNEWMLLATKHTGSDEEYLYFEASTPGFSPFAISGEEMETVSTTENEYAQVNAGSPASDEEVPDADPDIEPESEEDKSIPLISFIATIAIVSFACIIYRIKQN